MAILNYVRRVMWGGNLWYRTRLWWTFWHMILSSVPLFAFSVFGVLALVLTHNIPQTPYLHHPIDTSAFFIDFEATKLTTFSTWTSTIATSLTQTAIAALVSIPIYQIARQRYRDDQPGGLTQEQIHLLAALPGDGGLAWVSTLPSRFFSQPAPAWCLINRLGAAWGGFLILG